MDNFIREGFIGALRDKGMGSLAGILTSGKFPQWYVDARLKTLYGAIDGRGSLTSYAFREKNGIK